jgi:hypothetical protein
VAGPQAFLCSGNDARACAVAAIEHETTDAPRGNRLWGRNARFTVAPLPDRHQRVSRSGRRAFPHCSS